jgi:D-alanyl-lipoteichoic acid acyltransferase DltB (MBOAT superfamily)
MTFNSAEFAVFLPAILIVYWVLRRHLVAQNVMLLVGSYLFYGWWDYRFLSLIAVSTIADYSIARRLGVTNDERARKLLLIASAVVNLGILGFFKYYGFFVDSFEQLVSGLGFDVTAPTLRVVLPIGISFYTFQTMSYTFDVYRRRIDPECNLLTFGVYVAYFPQLVSGPIERAANLLPQIQRTRERPDLEKIWSGVWLILTGLFKKVVLADGVAAIVSSRFDDPSAHGGVSLLVGAYAFSIQIYGDFSGYSSIARGVSRLLGIELIRNFEQPYLSKNISQFWRTWHISLSTWLHDYLYVPLGGNRSGTWGTYRNLILTMLLGGLWHGAAWTFVVWGGIHGALLAGHRRLGRYEPRGRPEHPRLGDLWKIVITFHIVTFAWIFFRANDFAYAVDYFAGLARLGDFASPGDLGLAPAMVVVGIFALVMLAMDLVDRNRHEYEPLTRWSPILIGVISGLIIAGLLVFSGGTPEPFIYFQF